MVLSRDPPLMTPPAAVALCEVSRLANGIYQVSFHGSTPAAIDQYLTQLEALFRDNPYHDSIMPLLIEVPDNGSLPVSYFSQGIRRVIDLYPNRPPTRTAVVTKYNALISIANTFIRLLRYDRVEHPSLFFKPTERDLAIAWLLQNQSAAQNSL